MKLALSGRLFESRGGYTMDLDAFLRFARETGWDGVEIRYPQLPLETPPERLTAVRKLLEELGLTWVFGAVEGIVDDTAFARAVRMLDLHESVGCRFTRFTVFKPEHIAWAQRFADEAARRGRRLVMQVHAGTLPNNVPNAVETLRLIDRPNVGLSFDACHLRFDGDENVAAGVRALGDCIWGVSIQNYKPAPQGAARESVIQINARPFCPRPARRPRRHRLRLRVRRPCAASGSKALPPSCATPRPAPTRALWPAPTSRFCGAAWSDRRTRFRREASAPSASHPRCRRVAPA